MDGEFREVQLEDVIEIRVEEADFRVTGKVMYCRVEVGSLLIIFCSGMCIWHYCWL